MNTTEKLQAIRAKCVELLEISSKRTPGEWKARPTTFRRNYIIGETHIVSESIQVPDQCFIAACAGPAEAGWRATIATIDCYLEEETLSLNQMSALNQILTAWEGLV